MRHGLAALGTCSACPTGSLPKPAPAGLAWALAGHGGPHPPGEAPGALSPQQVADALPAVAVTVQDAKAPQLHAALQSRQGAVPLHEVVHQNLIAGCRGPVLQERV